MVRIWSAREVAETRERPAVSVQITRGKLVPDMATDRTSDKLFAFREVQWCAQLSVYDYMCGGVGCAEGAKQKPPRQLEDATQRLAFSASAVQSRHGMC